MLSGSPLVRSVVDKSLHSTIRLKSQKSDLTTQVSNTVLFETLTRIWD